MAYELKTEERTIGELLSGNFCYELPDFQRDYQWAAAEAEELLDDLEVACEDIAASDDVPPLFLGSMLFAAPEPSDPVRTTLIVDGQQRLITFTILFAVLRDLEKSKARRQQLHRMIAVWSSNADGAGNNFHLAPRSQDRSFFMRAIQKVGATQSPRRSAVLKPISSSQKNMEAVRKFFLSRLSGEANEALRHALIDLLRHDTRVLVIRCDSLDYAYQIFLSINARGQPLKGEDIVIAEVIGPLSREERDRYAPIVEQIARYKAGDRQASNRDKTFFTHLVAVQGWSRQRMITDLKRAVVAHGGPKRFTGLVFRPMAEAYLLTRCDFRAMDVSPEIRERLQCLALLEQCADDEWVATAMLGLSRLPMNSPQLATFLSELDRFAHAMMLLHRVRSERRKAFAAINKQIKAEGDGIDPARLFALTPAQQANVLRACETRLDETPNRTGKGVLLRIEAHLAGRSVGSFPDYFSDDLPKNERLSIEHIVPKGPSLPRESQWRDMYPDHAMRVQLASCLGNLALINEESNQAFGQDDWPSKRKAFAGCPITGHFQTTHRLIGDAIWEHALMQERHLALIDAFKTVFRIDGEPAGIPGPFGVDAEDKPARAGRKRAVRRSWLGRRKASPT